MEVALWLAANARRIKCRGGQPGRNDRGFRVVVNLNRQRSCYRSDGPRAQRQDVKPPRPPFKRAPVSPIPERLTGKIVPSELPGNALATRGRENDSPRAWHKRQRGVARRLSAMAEGFLVARDDARESTNGRASVDEPPPGARGRRARSCSTPNARRTRESPENTRGRSKEHGQDGEVLWMSRLMSPGGTYPQGTRPHPTPTGIAKQHRASSPRLPMMTERKPPRSGERMEACGGEPLQDRQEVAGQERHSRSARHRCAHKHRATTTSPTARPSTNTPVRVARKRQDPQTPGTLDATRFRGGS